MVVRARDQRSFLLLRPLVHLRNARRGDHRHHRRRAGSSQL